MKHLHGFTLVELILFIIISSLLASTILLAMNVVNLKNPAAKNQMIATHAAQKCMEWFIGQRRLVSFGNLTCGSTTVPSFCNVAGVTTTVSITCTTIASDTGYKTISIVVNNPGFASLSTLVASYE